MPVSVVLLLVEWNLTLTILSKPLFTTHFNSRVLALYIVGTNADLALIPQ